MDPPAETRQLPDSARGARLLVCEQTGAWAVALRRECSGELRMEETRSVTHCWELLAEAPASFAVAEFTEGNVEILLDRMARLQRDLPLVRVAVVADPDLADYRWLLREAGAVHFTSSKRRLGPLARLVQRHLHRAPEPRRDLTEQVWASLPWGAGDQYD